MRGAFILWLLLITLLSLVIRLVGIDALLPYSTEPDAYIVKQAKLLKSGGTTRLADNAALCSKYPHLLAYTLSLIIAKETGGEESRIEESASAETYLKEKLEKVSLPYLQGRIMVALLSVLLVPATWLLTRRFGGPWQALFAAVLVATSLLHVVNSQQARPHAPEASFAALALVAILAMRRDERWRNLLFVGVTTGLAVGTLQNGLCVLLALGAAFLLSDWKKAVWKRWRILVPMVITGLFIWMCYPPSGNEKASFASSYFKVGGFQKGLLNVSDTHFGDLPLHLGSYDPILVALAFLGILVGIRHCLNSLPSNKWKDLIVILAYAGPYTVAIGLYGQDQARYLIPLLPFLAGLAALGTSSIIRKTIGLVNTPRIIAALIVGALLAFPVYVTGRLAYLHMKPDTMTMAARWLEENIDHKEVDIMVQPGIDLPLFYSEKAIRWQKWLRTPWCSPWRSYQIDNAPWPKELPKWNLILMIKPVKGGGSTYPEGKGDIHRMLTNWKSGYVVVWESLPEFAKGYGYEYVREFGERVVHFPVISHDTSKDMSGILRGYQDKNILKRILHGTRWGCAIEIYRFDLKGMKKG